MHIHRLLPAIALLLLSSCSGDGPTDPPVAQGEALVIAPGALLFAEAGATQQLRAYAVSEDGDSTLVAATWTSSNPSVVAVSGGGVATGGGALGSAQITATSGELTSAPVLVLRAETASGALLVADSQLIGAIAPVDPAAPYAPGWQYRFRMSGSAPAVGQVVLGSGGAPIGGRVVSAAPGDGGTDVVLELLPLNELFVDLDLNQRLSLDDARRAAPAQARADFGVGRLTDDESFTVQPFTCRAPLIIPLTLGNVTLDVNPSLDLDLAIENGSLQRLVVTGGIASRITANALITAAVEAKAECRATVTTVILPIGGPVSLFFGGQVPVGVGFEVGAKASFANLGVDGSLDASIQTTFGIDCTAGCGVVGDVTIPSPSGQIKPRIPAAPADPRFELNGSVFAWADLTIGNPLLEALRFKTAGLKAGLRQTMELATREAQAEDPAYASRFALKPLLEAKSEANLEPLENLLRITLVRLLYAPVLPDLAQSPRGTLSITPASVAAGDDTQLGERATFTVTLTDVDYFGLYAVDGVEIRWRRVNGTVVTLENGRPGCTDLAAVEDQVTFTCETDFLAEHSGEQTFYAFARTRIFGVPVPVPLEIANDSKARLTVRNGGATGTFQLSSVSSSLSAATQVQGQLLCSDGFSMVNPPSPSPEVRCSSSEQTPTPTSATALSRFSWQLSGSGTPTATFTANIETSASAGVRTLAWTDGVMSFSIDVADGTVGYELSGTLGGSGTDAANWNHYSRVRITGPDGDLVDLTAGRREAGGGEVVNGPPSVQLGQAGLLQPGRYHFRLENQAGDASTAHHASAAIAAAANNPTLILRGR